MYEMSTGLPPYSGDNFMEILTKKATIDPPVPITVRTDLPLPVSELISAAMSRNPDERPQSMDALEYELNKCLAGRGVAVAQILGMNTDANVVASLNSGLSMRNLDDGIVRSSGPSGRAGTHSGISEVWETRSGVSRSMPPQGSGGFGRPSSEPTSSPGVVRPSTSPSDRTPFPRPGTPAPDRASSQDDRSPATAMPQSSALVLPPNEPGITPSLKKKGGSLGPILLLLVLLGGGGALAYMMLNNAEKQSPTNGVEPPPPPPTPDSAGSVQVVAPQPDAAGTAAAIVPPAPGGDVPKTSETPLNATGSATKPPVNAATPKHPTPANTPKHPAVATDDKVEPKAVIIKQINDAEAQSDWTAVRAGYQKLGKVKGMQQQALYGEALAAFQQGDTTSAENISVKAGSTPGPWKLKALLLHADAIFKQGDAKRAKDNYISLRALAGDKDFKATVTKKIALCNGKLGLAERDGILN
jgi:hypothetical protein